LIPPLGYALEREVFAMGGIKQKIDSIAVKTLISYLDSDPENNIPRILQWLRHFDKDSPYNSMYEQISKYLEDPSNNWNIFMKTIYSNSRIEPRVRKRLFGNFALNAGFLGKRRRSAVSEAEGCNVPWAILLDPTSACNLRCIGCWAAQYGQQFSLDYDLLDRIVRQGKEMGTFVYLFTGGEPLLRKDDIIKLCSSHGDCIFSAFTNGTLLDEPFADKYSKSATSFRRSALRDSRKKPTCAGERVRTGRCSGPWIYSGKEGCPSDFPHAITGKILRS